MGSTAKFVIALKWNQQPNHPWMNVLFHTGLVTTIVMMKTTLLNVDLMVETVVETMSTLPTAPIVRLHIGLETTIVMMKTTMLIVVLMVETVVETMSTLPIALHVIVLKSNNYILYIQRIVA